MSSLRRDLLVYYGYQATTSTTLYRPIMFLYFRSVGLAWVEIAALEAIGALTTVVTEIPTGYVGDRIGRLESLLLGTTLVSSGLLGVAVADSFLGLAVLYPLWSLGWNLRSGSDAAWLYDRLVDAGSAPQFARYRGRARAVSQAVGVVGALVGGSLALADPSVPFAAAAALSALGLPALLVLRSVEGSRGREAPSPRRALGLVRETFDHRRLRPFVAHYYVLFAGVLAVLFVFAQPTVETYAAVVDYGGSVEVLLGVLYAAISLVSAVLSHRTGYIAETVGLRRWFTAVPVGVGVGLVGLLIVPVLTLPAILLGRGVADVSGSLAGQYVNDHLGGTGRATVLSAMRMVRRLASIPFVLAAGRAADVGFTTAEVLAVAGLLLAAGTAVLGRWTFPRTGRHSEPVID